MTDLFPEPTQWNGPDTRSHGSSNGNPVPYRCLDCDWRGKGSMARRDHWALTQHRTAFADDPMFRRQEER